MLFLLLKGMQYVKAKIGLYAVRWLKIKHYALRNRGNPLIGCFYDKPDLGGTMF